MDPNTRDLLTKVPADVLIDYAKEKGLLPAGSPPPANIVDFLAEYNPPGLLEDLSSLSRFEHDRDQRQYRMDIEKSTKLVVDQALHQVDLMKWVYGTILTVLTLLTIFLGWTGFRVDDRLRNSERLQATSSSLEDDVRFYSINNVLAVYDKQFDEFTLDSLTGAQKKSLERNRQLLESLRAHATQSGKHDDVDETLSLLLDVNDGLFYMASANLDESYSARVEDLDKATRSWDKVCKANLSGKPHFESFFNTLTGYRHVLKACALTRTSAVTHDRSFLGSAAVELGSQDVSPSLALAHLYRGVICNYQTNDALDAVALEKLLDMARADYAEALKLSLSVRQLGTLYNNLADTYLIEMKSLISRNECLGAGRSMMEAQKYLAIANDLPETPAIVYATLAEVDSQGVCMENEGCKSSMTAPREEGRGTHEQRRDRILQTVENAVRLGYGRYKSEKCETFLANFPYFKCLHYLDDNYQEKVCRAAGVGAK